MKSEDLEYPKLLTLINTSLNKGRTESRAFMNWFLENIYRVDDTTADDSICDDQNDKGIDGIYVDHMSEEIHFFQSKIAQNPKKTLGDTALKQFIGSLAQFTSIEGLHMVLSGSANTELKRLITSLKLEEHISAGFKVVGVFITNAKKDGNAEEYLGHQNNLRVYDASSISADYVDLEVPGGVAGEVILDCYGIVPLEFPTGSNTKVIIIPALANDLVKFKGIDDGTVFSQNVRLDLGKTKVNKDIETSIEDRKEHKLFPLYHNGITVLCSSAEHSVDKISIRDYMVVNGAQSLSALYRKRNALSSDLRIVTRIIEIKDDAALASKITHNSNNQNAIKPRDLKSNTAIQLRLKREMEVIPGTHWELEIKRGQHAKGGELISNELAGRLLLAYDLAEPWACHQAYKIFDELFERVFGRPEVTAKRIIVVYEIMRIIWNNLGKIEHKLLANYSLKSYFLLFVISRIFQQSTKGKEIYKNPEKAFDLSCGIDTICHCVGEILKEVIVDLNAEVKEAGDTFDYKNLLKSPREVKALAEKILATHLKLVSRGRVNSLDKEWDTRMAILAEAEVAGPRLAF